MLHVESKPLLFWWCDNWVVMLIIYDRFVRQLVHNMCRYFMTIRAAPLASYILDFV